MRSLVGLSLLLLLAQPALAQEHGVLGWVADQFHDIDLSQGVVQGGCAEAPNGPVGAISRSAQNDTFWFTETSGGPATPDPAPEFLDWDRGWATCASISFAFDVPRSLDHVHVRFDASRSVEDNGVLASPKIQELRLYDGADALLYNVPVFAPGDGSASMTRFATLGPSGVAFFPVSPELQRVQVEWYFEDVGSEQTIVPAVSLDEFQAEVRDPWIEFSSGLIAFDPSAIDRETTRDGEISSTRTTVTMDYSPDMAGQYATNLRVRVDPDAQFSHVITPDGGRIDGGGSLPRNTEYRPDFNFIFLEPGTQFLQVTIPNGILATHGFGAYQVVFEGSEVLAPEPLLQGVNFALIVTPLLLGIVATLRARAFYLESFGSYRESARNFMVAVSGLLVVFVTLVVGALASGQTRGMASWPPSLSMWMLWLALLLTLLVFIFLSRTAKAFYRITRPQVRKGD